MNRRRGYSLVEVIVVMATASVLLGLTVTLLYTLFRAERGGRDQVRHYTALGRLAEQFRRDVHAATAADAIENQEWEFSLSDNRTVTYRMEPGRVIRLEQAGEASPRRESFALPPGMTAAVEIDTDAEPTFARLVIVPAPAGPERPRGRPMQIDAMLGRDHRFIQEPGT